MNDILNTILKDTYTISGLKSRIRLLKTYLENAIFGGQPLNLASQDLAWLGSLGKDFFTQFSKDNLYQKFQELEAQTPKIPLLTIYLPIDPSDAVNLQIGSYLRKTFSRIILLDPKFDPNLIAGAALVWNGVYRDYSIRARIEERKEEILAGFKQFL